VPAHAGTLAGLPPAYVFTTSGDPLRLEGWRYAERLAADGVEVTAQFLPGGYHGFEYEVPDSAIARRAVGQWIEVLRRVATTHQRTEENKELA
jgi:acetyl esterase